jgi:hypothetical protein
MQVSAKSSVAYPASSDAEAREELATKLRELAGCYGKLAERAMAQGDRHSVYDCVSREREAHNRANRVERGFIRF